MGTVILNDLHSERRRRAAIAFCVLSAALVWSCNREEREERFGLRLGMTPAEVRASLVIPGAFETNAGDADLVLTFVPSEDDRPREGLSSARFEFHGGVLVAARAQLETSAPLASGAPFEVTPNALTRRESSHGGVRLHWISRHCPTHAAEVERLLAQQPSKR